MPPRHSRLSLLCRLPLWVLPLLALAAPSGLAGQAPAPAPTDTYRDAAARTLIELGRNGREASIEGLESFEGRMWERIYVGVSAARFRRERGIIRQERAAAVRWSPSEGNIIVWDGARRDLPFIGISTATPRASAASASTTDEETREQQDELVTQLLGDASPMPLSFSPGDDRIFFGGGNWALHPLSDTAAFHYRYRSGDTITIRLAGRDDPVRLVEVQVEPRRADFRLISGSLWFDPESGALVRATYRPSTPLTVNVNAQSEGRVAGRIARSFAAEVHYISVDHGLFDFRWWIPRRFAFEGEARMGGIVRLPVTIEWTMSGLVANEAPSEALYVDGVPEGWRVAVIDSTGRDGRPTRIVVPPIEVLSSSPRLSDAGDLTSQAFSAQELGDMERLLRGLAPAPNAWRPRLSWGLGSGLTRYNRVEGLSTGLAVDMDLTREWSLQAEGRLGVADLQPNGELRAIRNVRRGSSQFGIYRRLQTSSEWADHGLTSSLSTLFLGGERTPYHRTLGAEAMTMREGRRGRVELRAFGEGHRGADRETDFHLRGIFSGDSLPANLSATEGEWFGASAAVRWQSGLDPNRVRAFGRASLETATGSSDYARAWGSLALAAPLGNRLLAGVEGGGGSVLGEAPVQRLFYPGGPAIFRFAEPGRMRGEAFWFARGELGSGFTGARLVLFSDLLELGSRESLGSGRPHWASGVGASFLDGLVRVEVARDMRGVDGWRVFAFLDGLF